MSASSLNQSITVSIVIPCFNHGQYIQEALDSIDFENCYKNPKPINIQMTEKVNVIVWYHLIDFDDRSRIIYYRNIYNKPLN